VLPGGNVGPGGYRAGSWKASQNWPIVVTGFAARERLTIVPAVPQHDYGPEVCLGPAVLDLPGLPELAVQLGGRVLYLPAAPFDRAAVDGDQPEDPACAPARAQGTDRPGQRRVRGQRPGALLGTPHRMVRRVGRNSPTPRWPGPA
jgi:hypothetical protein